MPIDEWTQDSNGVKPSEFSILHTSQIQSRETLDERMEKRRQSMEARLQCKLQKMGEFECRFRGALILTHPKSNLPLAIASNEGTWERERERESGSEGEERDLWFWTKEIKWGFSKKKKEGVAREKPALHVASASGTSTLYVVRFHLGQIALNNPNFGVIVEISGVQTMWYVVNNRHYQWLVFLKHE